MLVAGLLVQASPSVSGQAEVLPGILFAIAVIMAIFVGISAWYISAYIKSYYYSDDDGFITIRKGVFTPTEIHVQYNRIQDVYVDQDLFDRIFGICDVHIATATILSGMEAHIDGVDFTVSEGLKNFLLGSIRTSGQAAQAPAATQPAPQATLPVTTSVTQATSAPSLPNEISSKVYPLGSGWFASQIAKNILGVGIFSLVILIGLMRTLIDILNHGNQTSHVGTYIVIVILALLLLSIVMVIVQRSNYYFIFTTDFVLYRTGFISIQERHVPYSKIQDVTVSRGLIDMIFGIWTVTIENAAQMQVGRYSQNSKVAIMGLTKDQADYIASQARVIMNQTTNQGTRL